MAGPHATLVELGVLLDPLAEGDGAESRPSEDDPTGLLPTGELLQDGLAQLGQAVVLVLGLLGQLLQFFLLVFGKKKRKEKKLTLFGQREAQGCKDIPTLPKGSEREIFTRG